MHRSKTSGRAFPVVSFVYLSAECPFDEFYGINGRPKLDAKLVDRVFHRRRQVSPPVNSLTHRASNRLFSAARLFNLAGVPLIRRTVQCET